MDCCARLFELPCLTAIERVARGNSFIQKASVVASLSR